MSSGYEIAPRNAEAILKLIAKTASGRKLLESFLPILSKGKVRIEAYPLELVAKLREVLPAGQPIGACFLADPVTQTGKIHLDFTSPLGVLAPFLVHEIVHALDSKVWRGEVRTSRRVLVATESDAFQYQFLFTQELRERDPAYELFLRAHFPKARILNELLEPEDIEALYTEDDRNVA